MIQEIAKNLWGIVEILSNTLMIIIYLACLGFVSMTIAKYIIDEIKKAIRKHEKRF